MGNEIERPNIETVAPNLMDETQEEQINKEEEVLKTNETLVNASPLHSTELYLKERYDFRRNIITDKTEWRNLSDKMFFAMSDRDYNSLYRKLEKEGYKTSISNIRALLNSDFVDNYNPFLAYFYSLPRWDEKTDYILQLAKTVKTTEDELWYDCFKRWIVALVGCATDDSITNHTVIVFAGKQGIGKTTWHLNLVPQQLKDYRYSGNIRPNNKDSIIHLSECILINLDELESLNRSELGDLKEMITKSAIRLRRPYGYTNERFHRRASFTGSVNKPQFLTDDTGSRRFLCFDVIEIDYKKSIDLDLVFAQATHLLNTGFKYWFDEDEIKSISSNNEKFQMVTAEEELLLKYFEPVLEETNAEAYTTTDMAKIIIADAKIGLSNAFTNNLGKALNKHRFIRVKRKGVYAYLAKRVAINTGKIY